jgi:hypothetical protein
MVAAGIKRQVATMKYRFFGLHFQMVMFGTISGGR